MRRENAGRRDSPIGGHPSDSPVGGFRDATCIDRIPFSPTRSRAGPRLSRNRTDWRHALFRILASLVIPAQAAVDVNKASQDGLQSVKGIGPQLSNKILDARKTGAFKDRGDPVDRVSGVGPGNASRFSQAGLTAGSASYVAVATADKPAAVTKADVAPAVKAAPATATPAR